MEYAVALPTGGECGDPTFVLELAELAERVGWDGVVLDDYVLYQGDTAVATCNTWVALAAVAVRIADIRAQGGADFTIAVGGRPRKDDWDEDREHIAAVRGAGADWWVEWVPPADRATMRTAVDRGPLRVD